MNWEWCRNGQAPLTGPWNGRPSSISTRIFRGLSDLHLLRLLTGE
jgi:hypothetical protein